MQDNVQITIINNLETSGKKYKPAVSFHFKGGGGERRKMYMVPADDGSVKTLRGDGHFRLLVESDLRTEFDISYFKERLLFPIIKFTDAFDIYAKNKDAIHIEHERDK